MSNNGCDFSKMKPWKRVAIGCVECFCAGAFMVQVLRSLVTASCALTGGSVTIRTTKENHDGEREIE